MEFVNQTWALDSIGAFSWVTTIEMLAGVLGGGLVLYAAMTRFTTLAAVVQMGSIQERSMPWSEQSKTKRKVNAAEFLSDALSTTATKVASGVATTSSKVVEKVVDRNVKDDVEAVKYHDQLVYTLSLLNVMFTAYLMGVAPHYFYLWHTPKAILYIGHRWHTFKKQNQHYLLYDFCYWANALTLIYCWLYPDNEVMFQIIFMVSNGPLAWAVLAFSQSLIFHSAPHMTSVYIHTSPMLLTYALRWYATPGHKVCANWPTCDDENTSVYNMLYNANFKFYLWWVVLYYLWVYVVMNRRIQERGYKTLFDRVSSRGPTKFLTKVSRNHLVQKGAYMVVHVLFAMFTMLLATAYWRSQIAHVTFITAILATSAWNASGFYFTVFANKYMEEVKLRAEK